MILKSPKGILLNRGHPLARGLVSCWLMNEGSGSKVFDLSGNGNTGTLIADTHFDSGKFGAALNFDGVGDHVTVDDNLSLQFPGHFSISAWFKTSDIGSGFAGIVGKDDGFTNDVYQIRHNNAALTGFVRNDNNAAAVPSGGNIVTGVWYHVVLTKSSSAVSIYVDGVFKDSSANSLASIMPTSTLYIGDINGSYSFNGQISHVMIYNRALSTSEISQLYRESFAMFESEPIELWSAATQGIAGAPGAMTLNTGYWGPTI